MNTLRIAWIVGAVGMAAAGAMAQECTVTVYVKTDFPIRDRMVQQAELKAKNMFHEIGVDLHWRSGTVRANASTDACAPISIQFDQKIDESVSRGALAYALPFSNSGTSIHVFIDRISRNRSERMATEVLAHVLAHEITHVLQGVARHSHQGVMKAHWEVEDYWRMATRPLSFAAEDVEFIHMGLSKRLQPSVTE